MMFSASYFAVLMMSLAFSFYQLPYPWDFLRIETVSPLRFTVNIISYCVLFSIFSYKTVNLFLRCVNQGRYNEISKFRKVTCSGFGFISAKVAWGILLAMTYFLTCSYYPWFVAAEIALFCYMERFATWSDLEFEMKKSTSDSLLKDQVILRKGSDHPYKPVFLSETFEDKTSLSATRSSSVPASFIPSGISSDTQTNPAPISLSASVQAVNLPSTNYAETQADFAPRWSSNEIQIRNLTSLNSVETQASYSPSTSSSGIQVLLLPYANSVQTQAEYFPLIPPSVVQSDFPVPLCSVDTQANYFPSASSVAIQANYSSAMCSVETQSMAYPSTSLTAVDANYSPSTGSVETQANILLPSATAEVQANILMPSASAAVQANYIPSIDSAAVQANLRPSTNLAAVQANLRPSTDSAETQANVFSSSATTVVQAQPSISMCSIGSEAYFLPLATFQDVETTRFAMTLSESTQTIYIPSNAPMETQTLSIPSAPLDIPIMTSTSSQSIYLPSTKETSCQAWYQPLTSSIETQADYLQLSSSIGIQANYAQPAQVSPDVYQPLTFTSSAQTNKLPSLSSAAIQADYFLPSYPASTEVNRETPTQSTAAQTLNEYEEYFGRKYGSIEKTRHEPRKRTYLSTRSENYVTSSRPKYSEFESVEDENIFPETPSFLSTLSDSVTNYFKRDSVEKIVSYAQHDFKPPAIDAMDVQISQEHDSLSNFKNGEDEVFFPETPSLISKMLTSVTDYLGKDSLNQPTSDSPENFQPPATDDMTYDEDSHFETENGKILVPEILPTTSNLPTDITSDFKEESIEKSISVAQRDFKTPSIFDMEHDAHSNLENEEDEIIVPETPSILSKLSNNIADYFKRDSIEQTLSDSQHGLITPSMDDMEHDAHLHFENEKDEIVVPETPSILSKLSDNIVNHFKRDSIEQPLSESQQGFKAPSTDDMEYNMPLSFESKEDDISVPKSPSLISKLSNSVISFLKRDSADGRTESYFKAPSVEDMEYDISDKDEDTDYENIEKVKPSADKIRTASRGPSILGRLFGFTETSSEAAVDASDKMPLRDGPSLQKIQEEKIKLKRISGDIGLKETKSYVVRRKGYCGNCWKPGRSHALVNGRLEILRQPNTTRTGRIYGPEKYTMKHGQYMQEYGL